MPASSADIPAGRSCSELPSGLVTVMVISPHADDAAAFCGGTLAKLADQGAG